MVPDLTKLGLHKVGKEQQAKEPCSLKSAPLALSLKSLPPRGSPT